jgi:hypothetical protein
MTRKSQEKLVQLPGAGTGMLKTGEARSAFNHALGRPHHFLTQHVHG